MSVLVPPATDGAAEGADEVAAAWAAEVRGLVDTVAAWCRSRDWPASVGEKRIRERPLGIYTVPRLRFHTGERQYLLDPVARYAARSEGVVDLGILPEFDTVPIYRRNGSWRVDATGADPDRSPPPEAFLTEATFDLALEELARAADEFD